MKFNMTFVIFLGVLITSIFAGCSDLEKNRGESIDEIKIVFMYKNIPYERERFPIEKEAIEYKLMLKYFDGSREVYTKDVTWSSSKNSVATIDNNGTAKLLEIGSTIIKAAVTIDGIDFVSETPLEVTKNLIDSISISPEDLKEVPKGNSRKYIAVAKIDGFDFPVPITKFATWTTDSPTDVNMSIEGSFAIAQTHSNSGVNKNVSIIAQYRSSSDSVIMKIVDHKLERIKVIGENSNTVNVGSSIKFDAIGIYSDGAEENVNTKVKWKSSNSDILRFKVSPKNEATGKKVGDVNVTAKEDKLLGPIEGIVTVKVNQ